MRTLVTEGYSFFTLSEIQRLRSFDSLALAQDDRVSRLLALLPYEVYYSSIVFWAVSRSSSITVETPFSCMVTP